MVKEILKTKEPVAYTCLHNDLKEDKLSHSYLLCGEKNPFKKDVAILLAQSIIENRKDFACEDCADCERIRSNAHLDVLFIDGNDEMIKKEEIETLLEEFSKTAVEASGRKVYIIDNINNSSIKVLNMILKFMEEPSNGNTYGIFITDDVDNLLETIVSRCERINLFCHDYSEIRKKYLDNGFDEMDAYLLSETRHEYDEEDSDYRSAKDLLYETVDSIKNPEYLPVMFYSEAFSLKNFKEVLDIYCELMIRLLDDSISSKSIGDSEYDTLLERVREDSLLYLEAFLELKASRALNASNDVKLLFDRLCCKIIKKRSGK